MDLSEEAQPKSKINKPTVSIQGQNNNIPGGYISTVLCHSVNEKMARIQ